MPWVKSKKMGILTPSGELAMEQSLDAGQERIWWEGSLEMLDQARAAGISGPAAMALVSADGAWVVGNKRGGEGCGGDDGAWFMWPDYGGAGLWTDQGACTDPEGSLIHVSEEKSQKLCDLLSAWQSEFECRVDHDKPSFFEWGAFHSRGVVLAMALSEASGRLVIYETPYEDRSSRPMGSQLWMDWSDEPAGRRADFRELGQALCSLDEQRALDILERAGVPEEALLAPGLTAAHLCAHLGFDRALAKVIEARPEQILKRDQFGCSPLDAATLARSVACVERLADAGASVAEPDRDGLDPLKKACCMARWPDSPEMIVAQAMRASAERLEGGALEDLMASGWGSGVGRIRAALEEAILKRASGGPAARAAGPKGL